MPRRKVYIATIADSYRRLYVVHLEKSLVDDGVLRPGRIEVYVGREVIAEGTLQPSGNLSGMAPVYEMLGKSLHVMKFTVISKTEIAVQAPKRKPTDRQRAMGQRKSDLIAVRQKLTPRHIEPFRPENLANWEPQTEADVYMAFGVLQKFTEYEYCCGASKKLLDAWGYRSVSKTKPDAVLIRSDKVYVIAEFKINSFDFITSKHRPDDVDVLVVWNHDATDESDADKLPKSLIVLKEKAKDAAGEGILAREPT